MTKKRVHNAMALPTMLYRHEMWTLQKRHESRLQALEVRYFRTVGMTQVGRVRNKDLRWAVRKDPVLDVVKAKQRHGERSWTDG